MNNAQKLRKKSQHSDLSFQLSFIASCNYLWSVNNNEKEMQTMKNDLTYKLIYLALITIFYLKLKFLIFAFKASSLMSESIKCEEPIKV